MVSSDPPIVALGIGPRGGQLKDTSRNILQTRQFVINLVSAELAEQMNHTSLDYDASIDELARAGLAIEPSLIVAPPRIAQSPAALECEVWQVLEAAPQRLIVLARVVALYLRDDALLDAGKCYVDTPALRLLGRMNAARRSGQGLHLADMQSLEPMLTDDLLQRMLSGLSELNIVRRAEDGGWLLARDLAKVSLGELHEGLGLRIPCTDVILPGYDDPLGRDAARALDHLRQPLEAPMARSVGSFFTSNQDNPAV